MLKRLAKSFFLLLAILLLAMGGFLWWASGPGLPPDQWPSSGIQIIGTPTKASKTVPKQVTVVSYNMGYASGDQNNRGHVLSRLEIEKNLQAMALELKELGPDLVFLQEVDFASRRSYGISQMKYLAKALALPYSAHAITWNKRYVAWPYWPLNRHFGKLVSGQAILSRYPLEDLKILTFPKPQDNAFWYNWFYIDRLVQRVQVLLGDQKLTVYNVHLEAFSNSTRQEQLQGLLDWVKQSGNPHQIVAGDFNLRWESTQADPRQMEEEKSQLQEFQREAQIQMTAPEGPQLTFPSWKPEKRIDFIFYSPGLSLEDEGIIAGLLASDHLPVWATLAWP